MIAPAAGRRRRRASCSGSPTSSPTCPASGSSAPGRPRSTTATGDLAERHGAILIDLFADDAFHNPLMWSADRLHLSPAGHRRVAAHVLNALGVGVDEDWLLVPPMPAPTPVAAGPRRRPALGAAALRAVAQAAADRRSSGDLVTAKRPELAPIRD